MVLGPALPSPFSQLDQEHYHVTFCRIGTEALMEILGLDPYQSETQYLEQNLRGIAIGNIVEIRCCLISTSLPLYFRLR